MISDKALSNVDRKVKATNGNVVIGGKRAGAGDLALGNFYEPTIITGVNPGEEIFATETFGPVVSITTFKTDEEALNLANMGHTGLASYFCTRDLSRVFNISSGLRAGLVGVNEGIISTAYAPFGGVGESGMGREGSEVGINEYTAKKYIMLNF